jgi:hypothetical protein
LVQNILIPPLTLGTIKATVLNCFVFRQTDPVPGATIGEAALPFDFDQ